MQWHNVIFSGNAIHRNRRYLIGILLWWIYIVFTIFYTAPPEPSSQVFTHHQPGLNQLGLLNYWFLVIVKSALLVGLHFIFAWFFTYVLLTRFLRKRKYASFTGGLLFAFVLMISVGYFLYTLIYPFIDRVFHLAVVKLKKDVVWASIDAGLIYGIKLTLILAAIILLKRWWIRQKQKETLEKEKTYTDLQLLKAQVRPSFLFTTLDSIIAHAQKNSPRAPEMLIKLSDLLSYMLYECDAEKVKLEKEIAMIREFIALEQMRHGDRLETVFRVNGNVNDQMISPLLLLPFIDNSFSYCNNNKIEQVWVNLDITIEDNQLFMKLINGVPAGNAESDKEISTLAAVQKRLELLCPGKYELKINVTEEMLVINLSLKLEEMAVDASPSKTRLHARI